MNRRRFRPMLDLLPSLITPSDLASAGVIIATIDPSAAITTTASTTTVATDPGADDSTASTDAGISADVGTDDGTDAGGTDAGMDAGTDDGTDTSGTDGGSAGPGFEYPIPFTICIAVTTPTDPA